MFLFWIAGSASVFTINLLADPTQSVSVSLSEGSAAASLAIIFYRQYFQGHNQTSGWSIILRSSLTVLLLVINIAPVSVI